MRIMLSRTDDTAKWNEYALKCHCTINELWQKKYACIADVYKNKFPIPVSDEQDIEYGIKLLREQNGTIYGQEEYLVPERVLAANFAFFQLSKEMHSFTEEGMFHLLSTKFSDLAAVPGVVYEKK